MDNLVSKKMERDTQRRNRFTVAVLSIFLLFICIAVYYGISAIVVSVYYHSITYILSLILSSM